MYSLAQELWPIGRSLSGPGVRETLRILGRELPNLELGRFKSGEKAFDWTVPKEWTVNSARLIDPLGRVVCDYAENNLSLVGYSVPVLGEFKLDALQNHLFSLDQQPEAIPYVTSYYGENWGFCLSHENREALVEGVYSVEIDTELVDGNLDFAELVVPGKSSREVLFSTYICHPSMANNELSGPVLAVALAKYVAERRPNYTYRFLFVPETIGSLAYLARNLDHLQSSTLAGYVLTCVGDNRSFSYVPSRLGQTVSDRVALEVFEKLGIDFVRYSWMDRGSDERQYCSPGVDLPVCSVTRTKYGEYPEYHTHLDQLGSVVTAEGLQGSFDYYSEVIRTIERSRYPRLTTLGEPQLGVRGLYPLTSKHGSYSRAKPMMDVISMLDGAHSLTEISEHTGVKVDEVNQIIDLLAEEGLVSEW